jgi:hypothetical protein
MTGNADRPVPGDREGRQMPPSHRHHFVSQFYLRNFAADPEKAMLFVVDLPQRKTFMAPPQAVAFENDFHTIDAPSHPPDIVETALADLEGSVATAVRNTIDHGAFKTGEDRQLILYFATLLLVKSPAIRKRTNDMVNRVMTMKGKADASDQKAFEAKVQRYIADGSMSADFDIEALRKQILKGEYTLKLSTGAHLQFEFANVLPLFATCVAPRCWNIYRAIAGEFATSDRPAVLMWADPLRTDPVGLGRPGTRLLFPLSSTIAISGGFELDDATLDIDAEEVAKINGHIIANCNRQVYARDADFEYLVRHNEGIKRGLDLPDDGVLVGFAESNVSDA